ncbi:CheR family methyltransferase [Clostridium cylindrosporum]|uniref:Putative methyltransferase cher3 n=1 Tax=Clostridium cylindrosporum DSM 605 TaxID=1121307 RepID=A0A0J8G6Q2_CLOCY|nr:protein-glutamate O-methyltransferase CheR [Clostridium cylindrosporum]KMT23281.1 putative methyltransferase cher3 [Clostridium cylindrosporum DSM 605]
MNIYSNKDSITNYISVLGNISSKEDIEYLSSLLLKSDNLEMQITFLSAAMLPSQIVENLIWVQKNKKCKIYVLRRYLYSYLYSLGVNCLYIKSKSVESKAILHNKVDNTEEINKDEVTIFLKEIYEKYRYNYTEYQLDSIIRRIKIGMLRENTKKFQEFKEKVLNNSYIFEQIFLDFSINTTEFFRNPNVFNTIRVKILPHLNAHSYIKIWCAGCSTGQEPYSLAIVLKELGMLDKCQIYATDINPYVISEARNGIYPLQSVEVAERNYKSSGGTESFTQYFEVKDKYLKIKKDIKERILFFDHSIIDNGVPGEFHLILCRNLFIYFNFQLQEKMLKTFSKALDEKGFLVLGKSEGILLNNGSTYFDKYHEKHRIYIRR